MNKKKQLKPPTTMTELGLRLAQEDREKLIIWLTTEQKIIGKEIRVDISQWNAGLLGTFICEIKKWEPPKKSGKKLTN